MLLLDVVFHCGFPNILLHIFPCIFALSVIHFPIFTQQFWYRKLCIYGALYPHNNAHHEFFSIWVKGNCFMNWNCWNFFDSGTGRKSSFSMRWKRNIFSTVYFTRIVFHYCEFRESFRAYYVTTIVWFV